MDYYKFAVVEDSNHRKTEAGYEADIEKSEVLFLGYNTMKSGVERAHVDLVHANKVASVKQDKHTIEDRICDHVANHWN
jgi:hypothetical protein